MIKDNRDIVWIAGVILGTAYGWDSDDGLERMYYDFQPDPDVKIPAGDLFLAYDSGNFQVYSLGTNHLIFGGHIMSVLLKTVTDD